MYSYIPREDEDEMHKSRDKILFLTKEDKF
uniref:Uncharacterized protein n=1 Tax=Arundo donax TaxID=35708 RepID=A0A0A9ACW5_ARUDO